MIAHLLGPLFFRHAQLHFQLQLATGAPADCLDVALVSVRNPRSFTPRHRLTMMYRQLIVLDEADVEEVLQLEDVGLQLERVAGRRHHLQPVPVADLLQSTTMQRDSNVLTSSQH